MPLESLVMSAESIRSGAILTGAPGVEVFLCSGDQVQFSVAGATGTIFWCFRFGIWDQHESTTPSGGSVYAAPWPLEPNGPPWQPPPYPAGYTDIGVWTSSDPAGGESELGTIAQTGLYTAPTFTDSEVPVPKLLYAINYLAGSPDNGVYVNSLIRFTASGSADRF